jgi:hypothetical protein
MVADLQGTILKGSLCSPASVPVRGNQSSGACSVCNWLYFHLSPKTKEALFAECARAAAKFVRGFDWASYKEIQY